jgi:hypothetical protein
VRIKRLMKSRSHPSPVGSLKQLNKKETTSGKSLLLSKQKPIANLIQEVCVTLISALIAPNEKVLTK